MARLVLGTDKTVVTPAIVKEVQLVEPYALLSRVKDDSNNDIGCVVGYHIDSNNQKYAVVCLNKQYRTATKYAWLANGITVSGMPLYTSSAVYSAPETATFNCDKIIATGQTSAAVNACRSNSFTIGGVTYYGQLPTLSEMVLIMMYRTQINTNDPSGSGTEIVTTVAYWSSNQETDVFAWDVRELGYINTYAKTNSSYCRVAPVLEIPIN